MKNLLALLVVFVSILAVNPIFAQSGYVESQNTWQNGEFTPQLNVYAHGPLHGKLGWSVFSLTSGPWSQAYAGPTWAPTSWLELSANIGIETDEKPLRYAASVWAGKGKFSVLSIYENGGSGWWQKSKIFYELDKSTKVAFFSQRYLGNGPYVEKTFVGKLTAWVAVPINGSGASVTTGVQFQFGGK